MNKLFYLVILALIVLFSGCALHQGIIQNSGSLSSGNFNYAKRDISGQAQATYVLGIGGHSKESLIANAKKEMLRSNPLQPNQALANITVSNKTSFYFLVWTNRYTVTADVVEFNTSLPIVQESVNEKTTPNQEVVNPETRNEVGFAPLPPFTCGETVTDIDGNVYNTVKIGSQCWMKENMKATKYDTRSELAGTVLFTYSDNKPTFYYTDGRLYKLSPYTDNLTAGLRSKLGLLYSWDAALGLNDGSKTYTNRQGICPNGWHISTSSEWTELKEYLNKDESKLKMNAGWYSGKFNNESGFSAFPAGFAIKLQMYNVGIEANFWYFENSFTPRYVYLRDNIKIDFYTESSNACRSVRCIKD